MRFFKSYDMTEESETGEVLVKNCKDNVEVAREKYNAHVYAVVSDNAAYMVKMGKLLKQWHVTCNSHSGNLLMKDIADGDILK